VGKMVTPYFMPVSSPQTAVRWRPSAPPHPDEARPQTQPPPTLATCPTSADRRRKRQLPGAVVWLYPTDGGALMRLA